MDFLSEIEKQKLIQFNGDEVMRETVKKVLLYGLYNNGVIRKNIPADALRNGAFGLVASGREYSNDELGADLRALWQGVNALEMAFNEISNYLPQNKVEPKKNSAR